MTDEEWDRERARKGKWEKEREEKERSIWKCGIWSKCRWVVNSNFILWSSENEVQYKVNRKITLFMKKYIFMSSVLHWSWVSVYLFIYIVYIFFTKPHSPVNKIVFIFSWPKTLDIGVKYICFFQPNVKSFLPMAGQKLYEMRWFTSRCVTIRHEGRPGLAPANHSKISCDNIVRELGGASGCWLKHLRLSARKTVVWFCWSPFVPVLEENTLSISSV